MMRPNPMDRNTGGLGFNKNIAQMHAMLDKMPDSYLTQLVESKDPRATLALMVLGTRQEARKEITEPPTSSVAEKVAAQTGLGNIPINQDNSDPRLMAGVGNMPITPRDSVDTPMTGVAQLPAKQMMADGGIVGFQDRGLVEGEEEGGDTDYLAYLAGAGVLSTLNPLKRAKSIYNIGKKGIQKLSGPFKKAKTSVADRFTDRKLKPGIDELGLPGKTDRYVRKFNPVKSAQTISGTAGSTYLLDKALGDDEAPVKAPVAAPVADKKPSDPRVDEATYNMFDKIVGGITSGDMTRFGLNMAERASKGGSGLTALTGGAFDTRKQLDTMTAAKLDRDIKKLYYEALATNQLSKQGNILLESFINNPALMLNGIKAIKADDPNLTELEAHAKLMEQIKKQVGIMTTGAGEDFSGFINKGENKGVTPSA